MQIKTTLRIHLMPIEMAVIKKTNAGQTSGKMHLYSLPIGNVAFYSHCGGERPYGPANPTLWYKTEGLSQHTTEILAHPKLFTRDEK